MSSDRITLFRTEPVIDSNRPRFKRTTGHETAYIAHVTARRWKLAILIAFPQTDCARANETVTIEIQSSWTGLDSPASNRLVINGRNGVYKAAGQKVDSPVVAELFISLESPGVE